MGLKRKECAKVVGTLAEIAAAQVKSVGKFVLPGVCMVKTRLKPATKAGKREVRQGGYGEGAAGQDRGEGLPCVRLEEAVLRLESVGFATSDQGPFVPWAPAGRIGEASDTLERGDATRSRWQYSVGTCTHILEK